MKRYYLIMLTLLALAGIAFAATKTIKVDKLIENSSGQGIEVDGVTLKDGNVESKSNYVVGSIQQSILTEAQFQAQIGTDWVAMKGQAVAGSAICVTYSICTLPDARNRFLRNSDAADTNLRGLVTDTTAKNGLVLTGAISGGSLSGGVGADNVTTNRPWTKTGGVGADNVTTNRTWTKTGGVTSGGTHGHTTYWNLAYQALGGDGYREGPYHSGDGGVNSIPVDGNGYHGHSNDIGGHITASDFEHSHYNDIGGYTSAANFEHSHADSFVHTPATNGTLAVGVGDSETAPDHIIVNTFVKIN